MSNWLERKNFTMHSGEEAFFKIECDALTDEEIETFALLISKKIEFGSVYGIPRGGVRIQNALLKYKTPSSLTHLIVDDVLTRGTSMEDTRSLCSHVDIKGCVLFARKQPPEWVEAVFRLW